MTIVIISSFAYLGYYTTKEFTLNINAEDVKEIKITLLGFEISTGEFDNQSEIVLKSNNIDDIKIIKEFTALANNTKEHPNQDIGTTHPIRIDVLLMDSKEICIWCGIGSFITLVYDNKQYNCLNEELDEYINDIILIRLNQN